MLTCVALILENMTHRHAITQHNTQSEVEWVGLGRVGLAEQLRDRRVPLCAADGIRQIGWQVQRLQGSRGDVSTACKPMRVTSMTSCFRLSLKARSSEGGMNAVRPLRRGSLRTAKNPVHTRSALDIFISFYKKRITVIVSKRLVVCKARSRKRLEGEHHVTKTLDCVHVCGVLRVASLHRTMQQLRKWNYLE